MSKLLVTSCCGNTLKTVAYIKEAYKLGAYATQIEVAKW